MKKQLAAALVLGLLLAGCGSAAAAQSTTIPNAPEAGTATTDGPPSGGGQRPGGGSRPDLADENTVVGRITEVSESAITIELAEIERPQRGERGDGSRPERGDGSMPERGDAERPERPAGDAPDGSAPERPGDGEQPPGGGGGRGGFGGSLRFTGETATYPLADSVTVRAGGPDEQAATMAELAAGDTVRLVVDDAGSVMAIVAVSAEAASAPEEQVTEESEI